MSAYERPAGHVQEEITAYKGLTASAIDDEIHITGLLDIGLGDEDQFNIQIILDSNYPRSFPRTYETGGRVPRTLDRHYYTGDDAGCCLCVPHLIRSFFPEGAPISIYIDKLVIPYFKNQVHYEITGQYVSEYAHNFRGIYEFYTEYFGTANPYVISKLVTAVYTHSIGGARPCPCSGKRKQRKCHLKLLKRLKKLTHDGQLALDIQNLKQLIEGVERHTNVVVDNDKRLSI